MIHVELNQSLLRGGQRIPLKRLHAVLRACARALRLTGHVVVSIGFVSPKKMQALNRTWRGKNRVTDVLSFELNEGSMKGEILINYEQAKKQAAQMGHSTRDELFFLIVHGILHVFGYDHETPKDAKKMFPLQETILKTLNIDHQL